MHMLSLARVLRESHPRGIMGLILLSTSYPCVLLLYYPPWIRITIEAGIEQEVAGSIERCMNTPNGHPSGDMLLPADVDKRPAHTGTAWGGCMLGHWWHWYTSWWDASLSSCDGYLQEKAIVLKYLKFLFLELWHQYSDGVASLWFLSWGQFVW